MDDLRTLLNLAVRHKGKLLVLALLAAAVVAYPHARVQFVEISPDRTYRLEHYQPGLLHGLYFRYVADMEIPSFVRLYRNMDNQYFGESPVLDFFGGEPDTYWDMARSGDVALGGRFVFDNVPPIGPGGVILEIPSNASTGAPQD